MIRFFLACSLILFLGVVSASFGYGLYLLFQPRESGVVLSAAPPAAASAAGIETLVRAARQHVKQRQVEQAIVVYRRALAIGPSLEAQLGLAEGEWLAGREEVATREFERALALDRRNPTALRQLARIHARQASTWPRAEALYREYLAVAPGDAQAQLDLARLLVWQRNATAAAELFSQPEVRLLMTPQDRRDYGFALVKIGRPAEAEPILESLVAARPGDDELKLRLAGIRAARGDWASALPLYRAVLDRTPDDPEVNLIYGLGLLARGDHPGALGPLAKAAQGLPENGEAALGHARALRRTGDAKKAAREYERALRFREPEAEVIREYADLLMERREYGKAEAQYQAALARGLRDDRLLVALAGALAANRKYREAVPFLEEAYARQPTDRLAFDLAKLYQKTGQNDRALELLRKIETSR